MFDKGAEHVLFLYFVFAVAGGDEPFGYDMGGRKEELGGWEGEKGREWELPHEHAYACFVCGGWHDKFADEGETDKAV